MKKERYPSSDLARRVRHLVSARAAAERYGFTPNWAGYICCPFHGERTASLKLYEDGGWYCFGCHAGGSSIDFVMRLFNLEFRQAVVRLEMKQLSNTRAEIEERIVEKQARGEFAYETRAAQNHLSQEQALDWLARNAGPNSMYVFLHQHKEIHHEKEL